jgi:hypothetical protein
MDGGYWQQRKKHDKEGVVARQRYGAEIVSIL